MFNKLVNFKKPTRDNSDTRENYTGVKSPLKDNTHDIYIDNNSINDSSKQSPQQYKNITPSIGRPAVQNVVGTGRDNTLGLVKQSDVSDDKINGDVTRFGNAGRGLDIELIQIAPTAVNGVTGQIGKKDFAGIMKQLGFFNPTACMIKIAYNRNVLTDDYDVICNANKTGIFPPMNFDYITYLVETPSNGFIKPSIYAYSKDDKNVGISGI